MTLAINDLTDGPDGFPKVEVLLSGLSGSVARVTAYRFSGGRELRVSGIIDVPVAGAGTWVDHEVPAQQATYRVEYFNSSGVSLGFSESVTVTLGFSGVWMHNPFAPDGGVRVDLMDTALQELSRPVPGRVVHPRGRRVGVMVSGPRHGLSGAVFDVTSHDLGTADRIQAFLGDYTTTTVPVICIRAGVDHAGLRIPSPLFLGVLDIAEEGMDVFWGGEWTRQRIQGDEVSRPAPGLFVPLLTRADLNAYYASRSAMNADNLTRLGINRRYDLAGTA